MRCEACREPAADWHHHHGYAEINRLDVTALCRECHSGVHNGLIPEPRTGQVRTPNALPRNMWKPNTMVMHVLGGTYKGHCSPAHTAWARAWIRTNPIGKMWLAQYDAQIPSSWDEVDLNDPAPRPTEAQVAAGAQAQIKSHAQHEMIEARRRELAALEAGSAA